MRLRSLLRCLVIAAAACPASCVTTGPLGKLAPRESDSTPRQVAKTLVYVPALVVATGVAVLVVAAQARGGGCTAGGCASGELGSLPGAREELFHFGRR